MTTLDRDWLQQYPSALLKGLAAVNTRRPVEIHLAGGAVRDWLLGRLPRDLDIAVPRDARGWARELAAELAATWIVLDEEEDVARVVWSDYTVDFSAYRGGAGSLAEDLLLRDFTINALAAAFDFRLPGLLKPYRIIDPAGGAADLWHGRIRMASAGVLAADPLRVLRAFRFAAQFGFVPEPETAALLTENAAGLRAAAPERQTHELHLLIAAPHCVKAVEEMDGCGVLAAVFPELTRGRGVDQPGSHHLDVLDHSLATLRQMIAVQEHPGRYFPGHGDRLREYLTLDRRRLWLRWAALFHDLGKPDTYQVRADKGNRITFYRHDRVGAERFRQLAMRLRWSKLDTERIADLIGRHMRLFHLNNVRRRQGVTARACLRLVKSIGGELPGLFLLAMADSLAGQGAGKPADMEESLAALMDEVMRVYHRRIQPVLEHPGLLNGRDLMELFGLEQGPLIGRLLDALEEARVVGEFSTRREAVEWAGKRVAELRDRGKE